MRGVRLSSLVVQLSMLPLRERREEEIETVMPFFVVLAVDAKVVFFDEACCCSCICCSCCSCFLAASEPGEPAEERELGARSEPW